MRIAVAVLLGALAAAPAGAGTPPEFDRCIDRSDGIASKMHDCQSREVERLDRQLNAEYQKLMKSAPPALAAAWRDAQRAWVPYRKAECALKAAPEQNGLGVGLWVDILQSCEMDMTATRIKAFQQPVRYKPYHSPAFDACTAGDHCVDAEAARLDQDLNAVYRKLTAAIAKGDRDAKWQENYRNELRTSERAWLSWRDAECALAAASPGGARDACRLTQLQARVQVLNDALKSENDAGLK